MKLGLVSVSFRDQSPRQILEAMTDCGLFYIEWGSDVHVPPEKAEEISLLQGEYAVECASYGTYFRLGVTPLEELPRYIRAAKILGTDILRLWCGDRCSEAYSPTERDALFTACRAAANLAEKAGVILCMECHMGTYTQTLAGALELMEAVASPAFRMYWQPNQFRTLEENLEYAKALAPYTVHIHVFHWKGKEKFPLIEAKETWINYLSCFPGEHGLLLEFMPDGKLSTLKQETAALKEIVR